MKEKNWNKIFFIVLAICVVVILVEGGLYFYLKNQNEQSMVYYDAYHMTLPDLDGNYLAVGGSDFHNSRENDYTNGLEKGKLVKYDKNGEVIWEVQYDKGLASTFTSVVVLDDGYVVCGSGEYSEYQQENKLRDAFLIKYDKDGNKVWEKFYGVLSNTRFNKILKVSDGLVVIGQSIYENMEVGNHTTGGGIIVKYDFDGNEIWHNNHGGNKSGNFNGIVEVNGDFYVVGKDAADSGNLVKFNKKGEYVWHKNYSYTDSTGFQDIVYLDNRLYVVGSKKILKDEEAEDRKTDNTDGIIVMYDMKGNIKKEVLFGGSRNERFNAIGVLNGNFYVAGISNSLDSDLKIELANTDSSITSGILLQYDKDLKVANSLVLGGMNNDVLTEMVQEGNRLYLSGYSNSGDCNIAIKKNNGKDYFGKVLVANPDLQIEVIR